MSEGAIEPCILDLNECGRMEISLNVVITKTTTASKKSAWDSQRLSKTTPLTAAGTGGCARNTRKTSNPLWLRVFIPQQCLPIFFVDAKTQSFHCFWQGPSCPGWCWRGTSLTVISCKCIYLLKLMIATVFCQGWSQRLWVKAFIWDS